MNNDDIYTIFENEEHHTISILNEDTGEVLVIQYPDVADFNTFLNAGYSIDKVIYEVLGYTKSDWN